tara:strand:+ start:89 stop:628 length:540 start_codon:yes stop_codon:yes gene_type:complete
MALTKLNARSASALDATILTGNLPAISGASLTGLNNTPSFTAYLAANQDISNDTITKITMNTELFDSGGTYDHSTNYRWTPATAGKYYIWANVHYSGLNAASLINTTVFIYKNGSEHVRFNHNPSNNYGDSFSLPINTIVDSDDNDYFEIYAYMNSNNSDRIQGGINYTRWGGYKIIGA